MIRYALECADCESTFDAWFASSEAYDKQAASGLLCCAICSSPNVGKQIMAPAVSGTKASSINMRDGSDMQKLAAKARAHIAKSFDYVGGDFAREARAMHSGDEDMRPIWGHTTADEAAALKDEGVTAEPIPPEITPPIPKTDKDKMN